MSLSDKVNKIKQNDSLTTSEKLDKISVLYSLEDYEVSSRTDNQLIMIRKKTFSFLWGFLWFLLWGFGLIVYLLYYLSKKDEVYTITFPKKMQLEDNKDIVFHNGSPIIRKEFSDNTYYIDIDECVIGTFLKIKKEILEQYKPLGYDITSIDKETDFMIKSTTNERSYIKVFLKNQIVSIEAYNVQVPPVMYDNTNIFKEKNNTSNTDKLIELSKLVDKGLLTKKEFEQQKNKLLND